MSTKLNSSAIATKTGVLPSPLSDGGSRGGCRSFQELPHPLLAKEGGKRSNVARFRLPALIVTAMTLLASVGCGQTSGAILYFLGVGRGKTVEARFRLTEKPILILVDDNGRHGDMGASLNNLVDELAQELLHNEAAAKIVPRVTLERLRQAVPDIGKRGAREIGEMAHAEQVIWIQVRDYYADPQIRDAVAAAYFNVSVKVLNVAEKKRTRVRLWPTSPRGHLVTVTLSGSEASIAGTRRAIAKKLADKLAELVAKLFYKHKLDDFERES